LHFDYYIKKSILENKEGAASFRQRPSPDLYQKTTSEAA